YLFMFSSVYPTHPHLHSFPTRRSSDLPRARGFIFVGLRAELNRMSRFKRLAVALALAFGAVSSAFVLPKFARAEEKTKMVLSEPDRKSTRLNSSHLVISYAVFCLKKKI